MIGTILNPGRHPHAAPVPESVLRSSLLLYISAILVCGYRVFVLPGFPPLLPRLRGRLCLPACGALAGNSPEISHAWTGLAWQGGRPLHARRQICRQVRISPDNHGIPKPNDQNLEKRSDRGAVESAGQRDDGGSPGYQPDFDGYPPYEYTQSGIFGKSEHYLFPFWG